MTSIQSNTEYDYNTTTVQIGFRRKSNDLFESVLGLQVRVCNGKLFSYFSTKTYVVGTQKNRLSGTVLLSTQNIQSNLLLRPPLISVTLP